MNIGTRLAAAILLLLSFSCGTSDRIVRGRSPAGMIRLPEEQTPTPAAHDSSVGNPTVTFSISLSEQSGDQVLQAGEGGILWVEVINLTEASLRDVVIALAARDTVQKVRYEERFHLSELSSKAKRFAVFTLLTEPDVPQQTVTFDVSVRDAEGKDLAQPQAFQVRTR